MVMTHSIRLGMSAALATMLLVAALAPAQKAPGPRVIQLAAQSEKKPVSSLAYRLLPDSLDKVEGNAAFLWTRAVMAARAARYKWTEQQWKWSDTDSTPLDKLVVNDVKAALKVHANALYLADQAALRTRCDWERPAPTIQNLSTDMLRMEEVQGLREIAHLLTLRCRVELAERRFDDALHTLRTGFALARHVSGDGPHMVLDDLVGIAVATIMLGRVEEWVQIPGSPNLYWALTDLPRPFIDTRRSIRVELNTIYRSFPVLRELKTKKKLSAEESRRLFEKAFDAVFQSAEPIIDKALGAGGGKENMAAWMKKMGPTAVALKYYPIAKKGLIASGRPAKEVEALPSLQVIAIYYMEQYDQMRDEILQWLAIPAWQGYKSLEKVQAKYSARAKEDGNILNVLTGMLTPAILKVTAAQLRLDRQIAGLRGAEALRWHVAAGSLPAKWAEITEVPGPIDPMTGKGLDEWYKLDRSKGVLSIPALPGMFINTARRFEMAAKPEPAGSEK
jgi:hypothetical protein